MVIFRRTEPRGLAYKLSLSILTATMVIIFGILYYNYHFSKRLLVESARETAEQLTRATMTRMESVIISAQRVPESLLLFLKHPTANENSIPEMLRFVLSNKPEVYGSAIAFAPYAFEPGIKSYAPYRYRVGDEYVYKDLGEEEYDYFSQEWYTSARDSGQAVWSEPYLDVGGGNVLMATYSVPFFSESISGNQFRGVVTADLSLRWLENMMNSIKVFETGYVLLISSKGTVITHPESEFQMRNLRELSLIAENESMLKIAEEMMRNSEGYLPFISLIDQRPCWMYYTTLPETKWHMAVVFPEEELFAGLQNLFIFTLVLGILGIILLSLIVIIFSSRITKPLRRLTTNAVKIGSGNFELDIQEDRSTREIASLGHALNRMQTELKDYMRNLETTTAAKERFESELNIASEIQQGMIPKIFPPFPGRMDIDIYALLVPARQVGGDLYDFFLLDDDILYFAIGDVSDKGVPASLLMAMTITLFRAKSDPGKEIVEVVNSINHEISKENANLMFVTFFMGILDLRSGRLKYCNAGHNYPLLIRNNDEVGFITETHGIPFGISETFEYQSGELKLAKNETLVIYTDGITEALSVGGELFGDERLISCVKKKCLNKNTEATSKIIMEEVSDFARTPERSDDITLMVITYFPEQKK